MESHSDQKLGPLHLQDKKRIKCYHHILWHKKKNSYNCLRKISPIFISYSELIEYLRRDGKLKKKLRYNKNVLALGTPHG